MKKMWKTAAVCAGMVMAALLAACSNGKDEVTTDDWISDDSGEPLEISGDVLTKCNNQYIPSDGFIEIPDGVTSIASSAFFDCTRLKSVKIPDSVTTIGSNVETIGDSAFYECTKLTSVAIPDSVTSIGASTFYECTSLTSVKIGSSVETIGDSAFYSCESLMRVTIPGSVTKIGSKAFVGCTNLTEVTFDDPEDWYAGDSSINVNDPGTKAVNLTNSRSYSSWGYDGINKSK